MDSKKRIAQVRGAAARLGRKLRAQSHGIDWAWQLVDEVVPTLTRAARTQPLAKLASPWRSEPPTSEGNKDAVAAPRGAGQQTPAPAPPKRTRLNTPEPVPDNNARLEHQPRIGPWASPIEPSASVDAASTAPVNPGEALPQSKEQSLPLAVRVHLIATLIDRGYAARGLALAYRLREQTPDDPTLQALQGRALDALWPELDLPSPPRQRKRGRDNAGGRDHGSPPQRRGGRSDVGGRSDAHPSEARGSYRPAAVAVIALSPDSTLVAWRGALRSENSLDREEGGLSRSQPTQDGLAPQGPYQDPVDNGPERQGRPSLRVVVTASSDVSGTQRYERRKAIDTAQGVWLLDELPRSARVVASLGVDGPDGEFRSLVHTPVEMLSLGA